MLVGRRTFVATLIMGGAAGLAYQSTHWFTPPKTPVVQLPPLPVTFGEWELLALDIKNAKLLVIDPMEETLLAQLDIGGEPTGLLHSGNGLAVAVDANAKRITVFRRKNELERLAIDLDIEPSLVAISPNGALFAVLDRVAGDLVFINTDDGRQLSQRRGLSGAYGLMFDTFGERLYVTKKDSSEISVFDLSTFSENTPIVIREVGGIDSLVKVGTEGAALAIPPAAKQDAVFLIDLNSGETERTINFRSPVNKVAVSPRGDWLYASSRSRAEFYRQSLFGDYQAAVETDGLVENLVLGSVGRWLGVMSGEVGSLSMYDTANNSLKDYHRLPAEPYTVAHHTWSGKTLVALEDLGSIWLLDSNSEVRQIAMQGTSPALITTAGSALCHA